MKERILTKSREKGYLLDGKPITENDILALLTSYALKHNDKDLELVTDYWVMLKESGHNGFYLADFHKVTRNRSKAIRI